MVGRLDEQRDGKRERTENLDDTKNLCECGGGMWRWEGGGVDGEVVGVRLVGKSLERARRRVVWPAVFTERSHRLSIIPHMRLNKLSSRVWLGLNEYALPDTALFTSAPDTPKGICFWLCVDLRPAQLTFALNVGFLVASHTLSAVHRTFA